MSEKGCLAGRTRSMADSALINAEYRKLDKRGGLGPMAQATPDQLSLALHLVNAGEVGFSESKNDAKLSRNSAKSDFQV